MFVDYFICFLSEQRRNEIRDKREIYQLKAMQPGVPLVLKSLPEDEKFSFQMLSEIADLTAQTKAEFDTIFSELLQKHGIAASGHWKSID